jgi:hypothetical protein
MKYRNKKILFNLLINKKFNLIIENKMQNLMKRKIILNKITKLNKKKYISTFEIIKFAKYNFSDFKINKTNINRRYNLVNEETKTKKFYSKIYQRLLKFSLLSIFCALSIYIFNGKELFKNLQLDKRILRKIKKKEQENFIDLDYNERKIKEFEEKFGINKPLDDILEKINFGNKEFNEKKEKDLNKIKEEEIENGRIENNLKIIDLTFNKNEEKEKKNLKSNFNKELNLSKIQLNVNNTKKNVMTIKGKDFEQISFSDGKFDNPDPRVLGTTVVFDSRLNEK